MRISRPCYDKPHRCPRWAGGGWRSAKAGRCEGGYVRTRPARDGQDHPGANRWRWGRCGKCGVRTVPWELRFLDPAWYRIYLWRAKWRK